MLYSLKEANHSKEEIKDLLKKEIHPYQVPRFFYQLDGENETGIKPKRFEMQTFAKNMHYKNLFHFNLIDNKTDKLLVIFHGFMQEQQDLSFITKLGKDYSYLFFDFPGHGKSDINHFSSREEIFFELAELIKHAQKELSFPSTIFYGYSMGGRVALELSQEIMPSTLIIESSNFGLKTKIEKDERKQKDSLLFKHFSNHQEFFDKWYSNPIFGDYKNSKEYANDIKNKFYHPIEQWEKSLGFISPGMASYFFDDMIEHLKKQEALKTLILFGEKDAKYEEHFKEIKKLLTSTQVVKIKNAGHNPHRTCEKEVLNEIERFLN